MCCSVGIQSCLLRYLTFCMKGNTLPTCKHRFRPDTFTPMLPILYLFLYLANHTSLSSAISVGLAQCSRSLVLRSLSCLYFTKQQLHNNYGYKACAEITCSSRSMTDRQHPRSHQNTGARFARPNHTILNVYNYSQLVSGTWRSRHL